MFRGGRLDRLKSLNLVRVSLFRTRISLLWYRSGLRRGRGRGEERGRGGRGLDLVLVLLLPLQGKLLVGEVEEVGGGDDRPSTWGAPSVQGGSRGDRAVKEHLDPRVFPA